MMASISTGVLGSLSLCMVTPPVHGAGLYSQVVLEAILLGFVVEEYPVLAGPVGEVQKLVADEGSKVSPWRGQRVRQNPHRGHQPRDDLATLIAVGNLTSQQADLFQ